MFTDLSINTQFESRSPWWLVGGASTIILGLVFLTKRLTNTDLDDLWALAFLPLAIGFFLQARQRYQRDGVLTKAVIGSGIVATSILFLAITLLFNLDFGERWLLFFILGGLGILLGAERRSMKILGLLIFALFITLGGLLITGKFLTSRLETENDPRALAPWGPGTSFLSTRSGDTHILDIGEGEVILLVHGSTGSIADWQESVVDRLAESYRVVAFDSYGFGLSERNAVFEYGHALWTQQAIDVLDALEIERAVVVGHSAGAIVAVMLAADHPKRIRGAILTGHGLTSDPAQMVPVLPGIGEFWAARRPVIGNTFSDSYREQAEAVHRIRGTRAAYLAFVRSQYSATSLRLIRGTYEDIEVPVLQMHGALDQSQDIDAARALSSRLADTRFVAIEGSDHHVHIEAPDQWVEEVIAFVESLQQ